jgi:hypothetical protein
MYLKNKKLQKLKAYSMQVENVDKCGVNLIEMV